MARKNKIGPEGCFRARTMLEARMLSGLTRAAFARIIQRDLNWITGRELLRSEWREEEFRQACLRLRMHLSQAVTVCENLRWEPKGTLC